MPKYLYAFVAIPAIAALFLYSGFQNKIPEIETAFIDSVEFTIEIADDRASRVQGLSDRPELPANTALLFVYPSADFHGIWMKDMLFPIDIAWLDTDFNIVHLQQNVSPDTYPTVFRTPIKTPFVLETNAGVLRPDSVISL